MTEDHKVRGSIPRGGTFFIYLHTLINIRYRMSKEKKQGYSNPNLNNKNNRNIQKESPHNQRGNPKQQKGSNQRDANWKKGNSSNFNEYEMPPIKSRANTSSQPPTMPNTFPPAPTRKVITAKSEQVQEALTHLKAL
jgi:hypothetical protein